MPSLQALAVRPANTQVCGALPAGLPVVDKTTNTSLAASSLEACPRDGVGTGGTVGEPWLACYFYRQERATCKIGRQLQLGS